MSKKSDNRTCEGIQEQTSKTLHNALRALATFVHYTGPCTVVSVAHRHYVDEAYFNTISWQPVCYCG